MRLWHYELIPYIDNRRLLSQHRECCALRGKGWCKKHATIDYAFKHDPIFLYAYHCIVMKEMKRRGYQYDEIWLNPEYRGKELGFDKSFIKENMFNQKSLTYPEHNRKYLEECINRLEEKGEDVSIMRRDLLK